MGPMFLQAPPSFPELLRQLAETENVMNTQLLRVP